MKEQKIAQVARRRHSRTRAAGGRADHESRGAFASDLKLVFRSIRVGTLGVSAVARKSVILDGTSTTTCRGCMSEHRRQEPVWTSVRGAGVKAVSPAERGRSEATRLDVGEHTRTLLA